MVGIKRKIYSNWLKQKLKIKKLREKIYQFMLKSPWVDLISGQENGSNNV